MGAKNNNETIKYQLICNIKVEGVSSESDIVGALFGQTEGLLSSDMDLKQLQKSGRIGRIQLNTSVKSGRTIGTIKLPSSMNKIETAIIAATLESVDRVGPCACTINLENIVDVRKSKRDLITKRASEIMKKWDVQTHEEVKDISLQVEKDSQKGRVVKFGVDSLPAGSDIYHAEEIILVEGRADIINLMNMNIDNTIALQGTQIPATIKNLSKSRTITALLDGDRGGDMILKELALMGRIEYVSRAPYKKEVEDLSHKEVKQALDKRVRIEDAWFMTEKLSVKDFLSKNSVKPKSRPIAKSKPSSKRQQEDNGKSRREKPTHQKRESSKDKETHRRGSKPSRGGRSRSTSSSHRDRDRPRRPSRPKIEVSKALQSIIDTTKKTLNAVFVGRTNNTILTVKTSEVYDKLQDIDGVESVILDGVITQRLLDLAQAKSVKHVFGAMVGEITSKPETLQFSTFNRL